ncbi:hypothetical protein ACFVYF_18965 [Streptomyces sp. NPDC058274]|uniref:hypothetical protein n=1 Tax=Streptomyces sp. NPDC058274 TaxID=3346416 RepID=UPI0036EDB474
MELSYSEMSWHQQQAFKRAAAAAISGRDVPHGHRSCDCCGSLETGPLDDEPFKCDGCDNDNCNPATTEHCFTGNCGGSGCSYSGECHLRWDWEPEFTYKPEDRPGLKVEITTVGGGTVGRAYDNNTWQYRVSQDDEPFYAGGDLWSGGIPKTHEDIARDLVGFLESSHVIPELV